MGESFAMRLTGKQRDQAVRVETILDAACELFTKRPVSHISMEQIAARAGLPLGVIYNLFGSKEHLVRNAFLRSQDNLFDELERIVMSLDDPVEQVHAMVSEYLRFFDRYSTALRFYYNALDEPSLEVRKAALSERYTSSTQFIRMLTSVCAKGQETGPFATDMPAALLAVAVHAVPHAFLLAMIESERLVIADVLLPARVAVERILDLNGTCTD